MERKYGCLESPKDYRDYRVCGVAKIIELPTEFRIPAATIKDQGSVNSCVAHSMSSMIEQKNKKVYSTGWIYGYRPMGYYQGEGMYIRDALKTLKNLGAVQNKDFNYNIEMTKAKDIVNENLTLLEVLAEDYKIESYARLATVNEIKQWIYVNKTAVPMAIATDNLEIDDEGIIQIPKVYPNSGHAILCVGWTEDGLVIQNSWGSDWGIKGLAVLPYEYDIREAWGVTLPNKLPNEEGLSILKPKCYILRKLLQLILEYFKNKEGKNYGNL